MERPASLPLPADAAAARAELIRRAWFAALSPIALLIVARLTPVDVLTDIARPLDRLLWSNLLTTHLDDCARDCRPIAYLMIAVPVSWLVSAAMAVWCTPLMTIVWDGESRFRASLEPLPVARRSPSQWGLLFRAVFMALNKERDPSFEACVNQHFVPGKSWSVMLFAVLFVLALLIGIGALLFHGIGLSELQRPPGRPGAVAFADVYSTFAIGIEQFLIVASWATIYRFIFERRRLRIRPPARG